MATNKKKIVIVSVIIGLVLILGVIFSGLAYVYRVVSAYDLVFAQQVYVNDIPIGGLTQEEALAKISRELDTYHENQFITLMNEEKETTLSLGKFSPTTNLEECLEEAYLVGHTGNYFDRFKEARNTQREAKYFKTSTVYDLTAIETALKEVEDTFKVEPVDATLTRKDGKFSMTAEKVGYTLNISETANKIENLLKEEGDIEAPLQVVMDEVAPKVTQEQLKLAQTPLASFSTSYNNADLDRNLNLKLAAQKINKQLAPGEIFSLAEQLEPITAEAGYKASKVIVNGKLEEGIGGGVCQIASTLYNALLLSDVEIYSRANHSLPVAYVPLGRDATYASDIIDFKFRNNSEYPLFVEAYCANNQVIVNLFGYKGLKLNYDEIKFASELIETIQPPEPEIIEDPNLYVDQKIQESRPREGKKVKLYRLFYRNGILVDKQLINTSTYKATAEVIRVGTKPRNGAEPTTTPKTNAQTSDHKVDEEVPLMPTASDNPEPLDTP